MPDSPQSIRVRTAQERIAEISKRINEPIQNLSHYIDVGWLREAVGQTPRGKAPGPDGVTADRYAEDLDANLHSLLDRVRAGQYRPSPVRRAWIPKASGSLRPIGIPNYEDRVLQRAYKMVLEPIYEQEFYDFSYGFRPGRSAHDAHFALTGLMWRMKGGWVLDADVSSFFDTLDHGFLREILEQRVTDRGVLRHVVRWLRAGVLDEDRIERTTRGTPQGGVISPLLANIYLHEVLDTWWVQEVLPRMRGTAHLIRYADDFVMVFSREDDARRVNAVLAKRFARYGLTLHPEKTRMVRFSRPRHDGSGPKAGTFDFLGFTHYWARSTKGRWSLKAKTMSSRLRRAIAGVTAWTLSNRHQPLDVQAKGLSQRLRGHCQYYGVQGNSRALRRFFALVKRRWKRALHRRSQRGITWKAFLGVLQRHPLPAPRVRHWEREWQDRRARM